jgi:cullin 1
MVTALVHRWEDHLIMEKWLCRFFVYLDRYYVKHSCKKPLQVFSRDSFRNIIFEQTVQQSITKALLELVRADRIDGQVDRALIRDAIRVIVCMGKASWEPYHKWFEQPFLEATRDFYQKQASLWLTQGGSPYFLRKAEERFAQEKTRLAEYLDPATKQPLGAVLQQVLLLEHQQELITHPESGVRVMLDNHAVEDLSRLYRLYSTVPGSLDAIAVIVNVHIASVGKELLAKVNEEKNFGRYVESLIAIHNNFYSLVVECFGGHAVFHKALAEAFEDVVNEKVCNHNTAELLSNFANSVLKKGGLAVKMTEQEIDSTLDNIVRLFTYISEKDTFAEFYSKHLSKRLLLQRSHSDEAERKMISKLKLKCGALFTSTLEGMMNDMQSATEHAKGFSTFLSHREDRTTMDLSVHTLTAGSWPSYKAQELKLAPLMQQCLSQFEAYYHKQTNHRKLSWIHQLGVVTIAGAFDTRRIDLTVSTIQATILQLFNEQKSCSVKEVGTLTGLSPSVVKGNLRALCSGKFQILLKHPAKGYAPGHTISANRGFTSAQRRIRIPNPATKTSQKERVKSQEAVLQDRKHIIEACIVRVMKTRKTLQHPQLIAEVSAQLMKYFKPNPRNLKRRIEDLIQQDYLERDSNSSSTYHYVA